MTELKQHAWLLSLVTVLLLAKFIVVPVFDWQAEKLAKITLLEKKQSKIAQLLGQKNNATGTNSALTTVLKQVDGLFSPFQTDTGFKLTQQKRLEALLVKHKLTTQNIGWKTPSVFKNLAMVRYPIELRFKGQTADVIEFMVALEARSELIEINDFNFSFKGQREQNLGSITGRMTLYLFVNDSQTKPSQKSVTKGVSS